ncbi:hypothetical protein BDQ17DRAFT_1429691 [Cyathus striatus]|nr:hypothetical protein BDQ17DRAFT_1429691 [Cyathus striatus]
MGSPPPAVVRRKVINRMRSVLLVTGGTALGTIFYTILGALFFHDKISVAAAAIIGTLISFILSLIIMILLKFFWTSAQDTIYTSPPSLVDEARALWNQHKSSRRFYVVSLLICGLVLYYIGLTMAAVVVLKQCGYRGVERLGLGDSAMFGYMGGFFMVLYVGGCSLALRIDLVLKRYAEERKADRISREIAIERGDHSPSS